MAQPSKSNPFRPNTEKASPFDLFNQEIQRIDRICDENAQKFLAKLWFQNLLTAKLSFQFLNVRVVLSPRQE
jgi:hypothetical protein